MIFLGESGRLEFKKQQFWLCIILSIFYGFYPFLTILFLFKSYGTGRWVPFQLFPSEWFPSTINYQLFRNDLNTFTSQIFYFYFSLIGCLIEAFIILFSQSVYYCIEMLCYNSPSKTTDNNTGAITTIKRKSKVYDCHFGICATVNIQFDKCLNELYKLESIVNQCNYFSAWILLVYKGFILISACLCIYALIEFISSPNYEDKSQLGAYVLLMVLQIIRITAMLMTMGKIPDACKKFKCSWSLVLEELTEVQQQQLILIKPFGLFCGIFYKIKSGTILTYFEILTTYVIVCLQIFNVQK